MKKLLCFCCVLFFTLNAIGQTQDLTELIDKCSPAIFKITTYDAAGKDLAVGTGFFISSNGTALSNYHVFQGAAKAKIKTNDNKTYLVENVLAWSKESDMLKFSIKNELNEVFPFLKMNAVSPKPGEKIFIIGNPLGLEKSVADGIVASVRQDDKMGETIQITAPISHGNSGSPLMNMNGEALGIVTYFLENGQNLNFAVSIKNLNILDPVNALKFPAEDGSEQSTVSSNNGSDSGSNSIINYDDPASTFYFIDSKVKFCTELDANEQPQNPDEVYSIDKKKDNWIYVWVGNNGKPLGTEQLIVDIYKKKNKNSKSYDKFVTTEKYNITNTWPDTHFKHIFKKAGYYVFRIYTKNNVWIQNGYITIEYLK